MDIELSIGATICSLCCQVHVVSVQGHTASSFTVLVQENGFSQTSPEIIQNDSIVWHNIDNSSNITHDWCMTMMEMVCTTVHLIGIQENCMPTANMMRTTQRLTQIVQQVS